VRGAILASGGAGVVSVQDECLFVTCVVDVQAEGIDEHPYLHQSSSWLRTVSGHVQDV